MADGQIAEQEDQHPTTQRKKSPLSVVGLTLDLLYD